MQVRIVNRYNIKAWNTCVKCRWEYYICTVAKLEIPVWNAGENCKYVQYQGLKYLCEMQVRILYMYNIKAWNSCLWNTGENCKYVQYQGLKYLCEMQVRIVNMYNIKAWNTCVKCRWEYYICTVAKLEIPVWNAGENCKYVQYQGLK